MPSKQGQLSQITIRGYKSICDCQIELKPINIIIGGNESGKSDFLSAFTLLQNILRRNLAVASAQSDISSLFYNGVNHTKQISMEFRFDQYSYGFVLIPTDDGRIVFQNEYFQDSASGKYMVGTGHSEALWQKGVGNKIDSSVKPILEKESWCVYHFHDTSRIAMAERERHIVNSAYLQQDAENLAAFLLCLRVHYPDSYSDIVTTIRTIAPFFDDFRITPHEHHPDLVILKWRKKGSDDSFTASQLSDGTLRFICLATLLLQPEELMPGTMILDEPEIGLHPFAITVLAELVKSAAYKGQVILSTQSVELLNWFDPEDVIVVNSSCHGSTFQRLNTTELGAWLEEGYSLGELWNKNLLGGRVAI